MDTPDTDTPLQSLKRALEALTAMPSPQPALFPDAVVTPNQLALNYDNWASVVRGNYEHDLSEPQRRALAAIDRRLSELAEAGVDMWSDAAMTHDTAWEEIRRLAAQALEAFEGVEDGRLPAEPLR